MQAHLYFELIYLPSVGGTVASSLALRYNRKWDAKSSTSLCEKNGIQSTSFVLQTWKWQFRITNSRRLLTGNFYLFIFLIRLTNISVTHFTINLSNILCKKQSNKMKCAYEKNLKYDPQWATLIYKKKIMKIQAGFFILYSRIS